MTSQTQTRKEPDRIKIIQTVQSPLGFFTLVVLVVEVILGIMDSLSAGTDRTYLIFGMIGLIFLLVVIVALFAAFRPEALSGKRPDRIGSVTLSPPDGSSFTKPENSPKNQHADPIQATTSLVKVDFTMTGPQQVYRSLREATPDIVKACKAAQVVKIMANKGLVFIGTDDSIVSTAETNEYSYLRKVQVILMSPESRWISKGFISLRKLESLETYIEDLKASHLIVESGMKKIASSLPSARSGIKYFIGEPCWRIVMTDETAFISNYCDENNPQVRDLAVCRFNNINGSLYSAFKRHFNNIWHNESEPGSFMRSTIDFTVSAGGIIYADIGDETFVLLLRRQDGYWVLPKGHKKVDDHSIGATTLREVSEEAGIPTNQLNIQEPLEVYTDTTHEPKVVHLFSVRYLGAELPRVNPDADHAEARWWPISQPFPVMLYPYQATTLVEFSEKHLADKKNQDNVP